MKNLYELEACWRLGVISKNELPELGAKLMEEDLNSQELLDLALCPMDRLEETPELFEIYLRSVGHGSMSETEAALIYARCVSREILQEEIGPYEGAKKIWSVAIKVRREGFHDLDPFVYAASEYEDRPAERRFFEQAIVEEAGRWAISKPGNLSGDIA